MVANVDITTHHTSYIVHMDVSCNKKNSNTSKCRGKVISTFTCDQYWESLWHPSLIAKKIGHPTSQLNLK